MSIHVPIGYLCLSFGEMSIQGFCPRFYWVVCFLILSCMSRLYILEIKLCQSHGLQIFSLIPQVILSFCLQFPLPVESLLSFIRFLFFFIEFLLLLLLPWKTDLRKCCYDICQRMFCLCFHLGGLLYPLIFKSLSHFKIIFVYDVRKCSNFKDLHVGVPISQHYLLKRLSFLHCISCLKIVED